MHVSCICPLLLTHHYDLLGSRRLAASSRLVNPLSGHHPDLQLSPCYRVKGIYAQPSPWVLSIVVDPDHHCGSGAMTRTSALSLQPAFSHHWRHQLLHRLDTLQHCVYQRWSLFLPGSQTLTLPLFVAHSQWHLQYLLPWPTYCSRWASYGW